MSKQHDPQLGAAIKAQYPEACFSVAPNIWFVAAGALTTREVCEKLNIKPGGIKGAVVASIENYFGYASGDIWEWLKVKSGVG